MKYCQPDQVNLLYDERQAVLVVLIIAKLYHCLEIVSRGQQLF
jgi:hypothetical protein